MKKIISVSLDEEIVRRVDKASIVSDRTKSWIVKKALENYLDEIEDAEIAYNRLTDAEANYLSEGELKKLLNLKKD
jgi:RHH-type rel operon transcriptional repressor/antitoxin RelB